MAAKGEQFNAGAFRAWHAGQDFDALTERTEVLSELWADIAKAYQG